MLKAWEKAPSVSENAADTQEAWKKERDPKDRICCLQCAGE